MSEILTKGLFNPESLKEASKGKVNDVAIELIRENRLNALYSQNDIEGLKDNIKEFQLSQPLVVIKTEENEYRLISGHRRLKAIKQLFADGDKLVFFDKEYKNSVPCIIDQREYLSEDDELLAIISSNSQRILTKKERQIIYKNLKSVYDKKCSLGKKPPGREREIISKWMGLSARTIQNYKSESSKDRAYALNDKDRISKKLIALEKYFTNLDSSELNQYSREIKELAIPAINIIMQRLEINITEL